ncbi:hypothetical protein L218DRAFT_394084 [Marasmius fiardii PR-910]|nr:hypothetical protein L218DRAFT_394084 [Marasmius fiardii PR-910]
MVEVKFAPGDDPFRDEGPDFETCAIQGRDTRGQITMYATAQLAEQYRTHCFSVVIIGTYARIIRWDRAGVVATSKFNYVKARWLAMFFHMYGSAKPGVRGLDTSVSSFDKEFDDHHLHWREQAREHLSLDSSQPLFLFEVHDAEKKECKKLVAARPFIRNNHSLTGRCYKVWDPETKQVLLMKDTWRVTEKGVMEEGAVYSLLKKEGVRNILMVIAYGDVFCPDGQTRQDTKTQEFGPKDDNSHKQLKGHCHTRLVFKECGRDVRNANSVGEMISAIHDSIVAHKDAYEKARILHRDISIGNIVILPDGTGRLIDWDLCKSLDDKTPRQGQRIGTWEFISAKLLSSDTSKHELVDDLESFFHVLSWQVLKYVQHKMDKFRLMEMIQTTYKQVLPQIDDTPPQGGLSKNAFFEGPGDVHAWSGEHGNS